MSGREGKRLDLVIACDCDPDRPYYGGPRYDTRDPLTWRGVAEGIPRAAEICAAADAEVGPLKVTWFVRSDLQIEEIHGSCAWSYREFEDMWRDLEAAGHETGWHPHLWRWGDAQGCWYQEAGDVDWIDHCYEAGYHDLCAATGTAPLPMRAGWNFQNDITMHQADALGVRVDVSALPGRKWRGRAVRDGSVRCEEIDWSVTPGHPYVVSAADYRRPVTPGEEQLAIREVPVSSLHSRIAGAGWVVRSAMRACPGERLAIFCHGLRWSSRYVTPSLAGHPRVVSALIDQQLEQARRSGYGLFVAYFHPDDLLPGDGGWNDRLFGAENFARNIATICERARAAGLQVHPRSASELLTLPDLPWPS